MPSPLLEVPERLPPIHCRPSLTSRLLLQTGQNFRNPHPIHAPDGQPVYTDSGRLTTYADDGWGDDPAKIGVNPWGDDHDHHVAKRHREYLSCELPGISPGYGKEEGLRGMSLNSPRVSGRHFISGSGRGDAGKPPRTRQGSPHVMAGRSAPFWHPVPGRHDEFDRRRGPIPRPDGPATGGPAARVHRGTVAADRNDLLFHQPGITCAVWRGRNPPTWRR